MDGVNSFNCSCDPGFTGELCQTNIDDCVGGRCSGNGECLDGVNTFTCECSPGYTGSHCDIQGLFSIANQCSCLVVMVHNCCYC